MSISLNRPDGTPHTLWTGDMVTYEGRSGSICFTSAVAGPLRGMGEQDRLQFSAPPTNWADVERIVSLLEFVIGRELKIFRVNLGGADLDLDAVKQLRNGQRSRLLAEHLSGGGAITWQIQ